MPSTRSSSKLSKFTVAEKEAINALVELKKAVSYNQAPAPMQRPRRSCTMKEENPAPRSPMDRPRRSNVQY